MVVHDVEVNEVSAGRDDGAHFLAQPGEVGRQNGGGDFVGAGRTRKSEENDVLQQ